MEQKPTVRSGRSWLWVVLTHMSAIDRVRVLG
jgi:hypothetical protein